VTQRYDDWLAVKRQQVEAGDLSPRTVKEYERFARPGGELEWWEGFGVLEVDYAHLENWSLWMAGRGQSAKTRRNVLGAFRSFLGWLKKRGAIAAMPDVPLPRVPEHEPTIISLEAQRAILAEIPEVDRGPYLVAVYMGLRPGEIRALDMGDVRQQEDPPLLVVSKAMKGSSPDAPIAKTKTNRVRRLPIPPEVLEWLDNHVPPEIRDASAPLFPNPRTGRRWSHWALRENWIKAANKAGVEVGLYEGTKHSFATDALDRTGNERAVQEYLGHADPRSTRRYARLKEERLLEVVRPRVLH
jgi:integrase/recombinase XerC